MKPAHWTRRGFIQASGGSLVYLLATAGAGCSRTPGAPEFKAIRGKGNQPGITASEWIQLHSDGLISAYTGRNELGQGLKTLLYGVFSQGFELPVERFRMVMGDTGQCPNDGPTAGSSATKHIAWPFWQACFQIREDLRRLGADRLAVELARVEYAAGQVRVLDEPGRFVTIGELAADFPERQVRALPADVVVPEYTDRGILNVDADDIVTGRRRFAADISADIAAGNVAYGAVVVPPYHDLWTRPEAVDHGSLGELASRVKLYQDDRRLYLVGDSFQAVQQAEARLKVTWSAPKWPREIKTGASLREGARRVTTRAKHGNPDRVLERQARHVIRESYFTHPMTPVPMETDTALVQQDGDQFVVHLGSQAPFVIQHKLAHALGVEAERVRVVSTPAGGAFGCKQSFPVADEAGRMLRFSGRPIRLIYSRKADLQLHSRYKASVLVDLASGVDEDGRLLARTIDLYQDLGRGVLRAYRVPNDRVRLHETKVQVRRAIMRGTSYTQNVFALESHMESVARQIGMDVLEFRRRNVRLKELIPVLDRCEELLPQGVGPPGTLEGVGYGICVHGSRELCVVGARVSVHPDSGEVKVQKLVGVFDFGVIMNRHTATMGVKGAMIWGLGAALYEQVDLDGHSTRTAGFADYRICRMRDVPPITVEYLRVVKRSEPTGCGESPLPPTIAAVANAVADATGARIHSIPLTREKVLAALQSRPA